MKRSAKHVGDATLLVALAATMWGLDGLLRKPLATQLDAGTVVLWEHVIAVLVVLPYISSALRAFAHCDLRSQLAVIVVGVGSSALATALFTTSFALSAQSNDFVTPLVLQKLQPVIAVLLAVVVLRERLHLSYAAFAVPAFAGAWLLTFAHPFGVEVAQAKAALFALGAAALWAAGTVLGRLLSLSLSSRDVTTLRFVFGLIGSLLVVQLTHAAYAPGWHNAVGLILLALVPGLIALRIYYYALTRTPASRATLAELAFPGAAAVVGVVFLHSSFDPTQWIGLGVVVAAVLGLTLHEHRATPSVVEQAVTRQPEELSQSHPSA